MLTVNIHDAKTHHARLVDQAVKGESFIAGLWEIVIKRGLGRTDFRVDPHRLWRLLLANGYREMPVSAEHALAVGVPPDPHRNPRHRVPERRRAGLGLIQRTQGQATFARP